MPGVEHASLLALEILKSSQKWAGARANLRRTLDSKAATPQSVEKAKADYTKRSEELEALVLRLTRFLQTSGKSISLGKKPNAPFPWRELVNLVATGAKAVETALGDGTPIKVVKATVIDTEGE